MNITLIIVYILWFAAAISVMPNIVPYTNDLSFWKQAIVAIVTILGAPFMLVTQAIELILDAFLAEGWNNDDDDKFGY
jgi:tellurite resistance protein TehA-like permease